MDALISVIFPRSYAAPWPESTAAPVRAQVLGRREIIVVGDGSGEVASRRLLKGLKT